MNGPVSIAVFPASLHQSHRRLWEALRALGWGDFRAWRSGDEHRAEVAWMQGPPEALVSAVVGRGGRCLVWAGANEVSAVTGGGIVFAREEILDAVLRGETVDRHEAFGVVPIALAPGAQVLATAGGHPWWVRETGSGGGAIDRLGVPPPELSEGQLLREHLKPWSFAHLLPLLHVARETSGGRIWEAPPPRACFIFDDPSLHWPSYGCLRFEELAQHAERHGYHAAIAIVPFDTWGANSRARDVFFGHQARLSLLIHGNDHVHHEMWMPRSESAWTSLLAQALRRVGRFERGEGLTVARVMEAPHALISRTAVGPLGRLGYEAALVSPALAGVYAREAGWPVTTGCAAMDTPMDGVCLLPRVPLASHWKTDVMLAAFLRQPIIVAGHHQDAAEGLDFLGELAAYVNRLDGVEWSGLPEIVRSRRQILGDGTSLRVRMGARTVECPVPTGTATLHIERPWPGSEAERLVVEGVGTVDIQPDPATGGVVVPVSANMVDATVVRLASRPQNGVDPERVPAPARQAWPVVRRVLAVSRDRVFPYLPGRVRRRRPAYRVP